MSVNHASQLNNLIKKFDFEIATCGLNLDSLNKKLEQQSSVDPSLVSSISKSIDLVQTNMLNSRYQNILEILTDIIATFEDEPYFSGLNIPKHPDVAHDIKENVKNFITYTFEIRSAIGPLIVDETSSSRRRSFYSKIESKKSKLDKGFYYEFTTGDLDRIQSIINELRTEVSGSNYFSEEHKQRFLQRLETVQAELHKKMGNIDKLWGLIGDTGVVVGKLGKDAKPVVDRFRELYKIVTFTQARAEELPSGSSNPLLDNHSSDDATEE